MKKYTVIQTYTAEDIYKNVFAESKEEAILKIGGVSVDEQNHEDTVTEVKLQEEEINKMTSFSIRLDIPDTDLREDDISHLVDKALRPIVDEKKFEGVEIDVVDITEQGGK